MNRLGGKRVQQQVGGITDWFHETVDMLVEGFMADGYAPGTMPLTPRQQYEKLMAWQQAGDPRYWNDPRAQGALAQLATRYGAPAAPPAPEPFGIQPPDNPQRQLAAYLAAEKLGQPGGLQ